MYLPYQMATSGLGRFIDTPDRGYMQFSKHADGVEHSPVTNISVRNVKIKDKRTYMSKSRFISGVKNDLSEVSQLFYSFDQFGNSKSMFFVDMEQLIVKNTKYGNVFSSLGQSHISNIINRLKLRMFSIDRENIKTSFVNNKNKKTRTLGSKRILTVIQETNITFKTTSIKNSVRKTVFPFSQNINSFEFTDDDLTPNLPGEFQYILKIHFTDPTIGIAEGIMQEIENASNELSKYIGRIKRNLKTKSEKDNPPQQWLDSEFSLYEAQPETAPWILAPVVYAKYKKMFFNTELAVEDIESNFISMIEPKTFTINNLNTFKLEMDNLNRHVLKTFNVKRKKTPDFSDITMPKSTFVTNLINIEHHFKLIMEPSKNKKYYNFLQNTGEFNYTKRVSLSQFKDRITAENNKFFDFIQSSEEAINNTEASAASYFSPASIKEYNGDLIELSDLKDIDIKTFNKFFEVVPIRKRRKISKPRKKSKFMINPRMIKIEEEKVY